LAVVPGVWLRGHFYLATSPSARRDRNLVANRHCLVCPEHNVEAAILDGIAAARDLGESSGEME
jgi:hypothetical protein